MSRLIQHEGTWAKNSVEDFWLKFAQAVEESLITAGAEPGKDYSILDLYKLAQPFVLYQYSNDDKACGKRFFFTFKGEAVEL